jgi:1-deoxy-D-xylulose-5-phosphate reductoisomerase
MGAVLNAADEVAVAAFLEEKISFAEIGEVVHETFEHLGHAKNEKTLEAFASVDAETRAYASTLVEKCRK